MGTIMIKTYSNPSHVLTDTGLDKNCIHVTSTQEMIQGYRSIEMYAATPREGGWQLMTSRTLINAFYNGWFGDAKYNLQHGVNDTQLRQCMEVGEMLTKLNPSETIIIKQTGGEDLYIQVDENLKRSMEHNTMQLTDALRLLTVLDLPPDKIPLGTLSRAQLIVVYLYQQIKSNPETSFIFERRNTRESVQEALDKAVGITAGKRYANNTAKIQEVFTGYKQLCPANTIIFTVSFS